MTTIVEKIEYRGHTIEIIPDYDAENPWENWDCQTPLMRFSGDRHAILQTHDSGDDIAGFFNHVSAHWVSRNWRKLCEILNLDQESHDMEAREYSDYYGGLSESRIEIFAEVLSDIANFGGWTGAIDYFDALEALYNLIGIPALSTQRNGYSQGDCVLILLVATPEHAKRCGFTLENPGHDIEKSLEADADLFGDWVFGNVYGYAIPTIRAEPSCFGFYGDYYYAYGDQSEPDILQEAKAVIDCHIEHARLRRQSRLKELIRNRVPLLARQNALAI